MYSSLISLLAFSTLSLATSDVKNADITICTALNECKLLNLGWNTPAAEYLATAAYPMSAAAALASTLPATQVAALSDLELANMPSYFSAVMTLITNAPSNEAGPIAAYITPALSLQGTSAAVTSSGAGASQPTNGNNPASGSAGSITGSTSKAAAAGVVRSTDLPVLAMAGAVAGIVGLGLGL